MPTNVLFTSWYSGLGGGETDLLTLADGLDPAEWTPHLLVPLDGALAERWRMRGWPVHVTPWRGASTLFIPALWTRFPVVSRIERLLREQHIDLVSSEYHTLPFAYAAAQRAGVPIFWTVWGWWFRPRSWQREFFRKIPAIARSESIRAGYLGEPPFMPPETLPIVYSGIDTTRFHPGLDRMRVREELHLDEDTPLVVMVARFQRVKGQHIFQEMIPQVVPHVPHAQFVVAGADTFGVALDEEYRQEILHNAENDPILRQHLRYIGFRDDVEHVLAAADVLVCASEFESYGKANLEAMACATPVVSTNQGGPSETVLDGETGYLVEPNDPAALAEKVLYLLRHPDERERLGAAGRQRVEQHFSQQAAVAAQVAIMRALLRGTAP